MAHKRLKPPIKYPGGKTLIAKEVDALMSGIEHTRYLEPFFGGGSVLLAKDPSGIVEVANDIYQHNYEFWATLRDEEAFSEFVRLCHATAFCETTWDSAQAVLSNNQGNQIERAHAFFICSRLSRPGSNCFATPSKRPRRGHNEFCSAYWTSVEMLPELHERLSKVHFFCRDAVQVIESQDDSDRLIYADPPYIESTRVSKKPYAHEMTDEDHENLVDVLLAGKSKILLSGYPGSDRIYHRLEDGGWGVWRRGVAKPSSSHKVKSKAFEQIWSNFELNTEHAKKWERVSSSNHKLVAGVDIPNLMAPCPLPDDAPCSSVQQVAILIPRDSSSETHAPVSPANSAPTWLNLHPLLKMTALDQIGTVGGFESSNMASETATEDQGSGNVF